MPAGASSSPPIVIVGSGLAGLSAALALAPLPTLILSKGPFAMGGSSNWAQGGIAAALGQDDTPALHASDTIKAGVGLSDEAITKLVTEKAPEAIARLLELGVPFDRKATGEFALGLEGAHSRHRIVHVGGDGAGQAIMTAMMAAVKALPTITILENASVIQLLTEDGRCSGLVFRHNGRLERLTAERIILATGGTGALFRHTTNPLTSFGHGIALAARAGALLADLEFVQFHPTAIDIKADPMPLASEALRGEGAILVTESNEAIMASYPRKDLEARDIVSREIFRRMQTGSHIFLDAREAIGSRFEIKFPGIYKATMTAGIDPSRDLIPVAPAAHYHMGGIAVNEVGRSSVEGLWAIGEVAATGLHGANRLASNSLLEAAVFGERVASDLKNFVPSASHGERTQVAVDITEDEGKDEEIRDLMTAHLGVIRERSGMEKAIDCLRNLAPRSDKALIALLIALSALKREESRGSHFRSDFPDKSEIAKRSFISLKDLPQ